tara:strand:+ start:15442 stop:15699 length:258 start_codon:yes stop_codon:yes gene_type:complete
MKKTEENIAFQGAILRESEKAIQLRVPMIEADPVGPGQCPFHLDVWIPRSLLSVNASELWEVPLWVARDRGIYAPERMQFAGEMS